MSGRQEIAEISDICSGISLGQIGSEIEEKDYRYPFLYLTIGAPRDTGNIPVSSPAQQCCAWRTTDPLSPNDGGDDDLGRRRSRGPGRMKWPADPRMGGGPEAMSA